MTVDFKAGARAVKSFGDVFSVAHGSRFPEVVGNSEPYPAANPGLLPFPPRSSAGAAVFTSPGTWSGDSGSIVPNVKKIAVLRSNAIGDFIFTLPALESLRRTYPEAEIVLLGLDWHAEFLRDRPGPVDRVVVVPESRGVRNPPDGEEDPQAMEAFFQRMEQEHFDLALQMHGGGRFSNPFIRRLGARVTAGAVAEDAVPLDRWIPYQFYQMEVLRFFEIVRLVGGLPIELEPRIAVTVADLQEAASLVPYTNQPLVVINPGAGDPRRRWPPEKFAAVANSLAWAGANIVITGRTGECEIGETISRSMSAQSTNLCGRISLGGLAGLLSRASVVISNDSGPLHMGRAVGAPTVGIYWCGNMINSGPVTHARHRTAISWRLECPSCGLNCTRSSCEHTDSFVADVTEVEVKTAAMELMEMFGAQLRQDPAGVE